MNKGKPKIIVEEQKFRNMLSGKIAELNLENLKYETGAKIIKEAVVKATITSRSSRKGKTPYWWTEEIAKKREKCLTALRALTRIRKNSKAPTKEVGEVKLKYDIVKKELKNCISKSKKEKWMDLCESVNNDIWGDAYNIVTKKLDITQIHHGLS